MKHFIFRSMRSTTVQVRMTALLFYAVESESNNFPMHRGFIQNLHSVQC